MKFKLSNGVLVDVVKIDDLLVIPIAPGIIDQKIKDMLRLAQQHQMPVATTHNSVGVIVNPNDEADEIVKRWKTYFDLYCQRYGFEV